MLKQLARVAAHYSGAIDVVRRLNQNRVRILMYHRFPREFSATFDRQCAFLASNYDVIPLAEAAQRLQRNESVANVAVITVDDGYADFHDVAFPILRKHRLPATLFVTTGFVNRTCWMPGDRVRFHFAHTANETVEVTDDAGHVHTFRTRGADATDPFRALLKSVPERAKRRMLSEMDGDPPVQDRASLPDEYRPCTWDQLRQMADGGISIGAHTVTHPILSRVETAQESELEIVDSKNEIENRLQRPVELFAYPNGAREDIDPVSVACVRAHFKAAVTAIDGLNAPGSDVYDLLRLPCSPDLSVPQLARLLAGPVSRHQTPQPALASTR